MTSERINKEIAKWLRKKLRCLDINQLMIIIINLIQIKNASKLDAFLMKNQLSHYERQLAGKYLLGIVPVQAHSIGPVGTVLAVAVPANAVWAVALGVAL